MGGGADDITIHGGALLFDVNGLLDVSSAPLLLSAYHHDVTHGHRVHSGQAVFTNSSWFGQVQYLGQATGNHQCVIKICRSRSKCRIPFEIPLQSKLILLSFVILGDLNNIFHKITSVLHGLLPGIQVRN